VNLTDINEIMRLVPHRYPFLLVDRVLECDPGKSLVALKNVTINEPFFTGHFPTHPVMPGVLILEALAQASLILGIRSTPPESTQGMLYYFVGIDGARFKHPVVPGDQLKLHTRLIAAKRGIWKFGTEARVNDELCCEAELMAAPRRVEQAAAS
jgi:3-hydroxyacyl-[acyl-carrier-protein] dehydratase